MLRLPAAAEAHILGGNALRLLRLASRLRLSGAGAAGLTTN